MPGRAGAIRSRRVRRSATARPNSRVSCPSSNGWGRFPEPQALAPHEERLRLFEAITRFLRTLAARRGLVVFLDDLHWADRGRWR